MIQKKLISDFLDQYGVPDTHAWNDKEFGNASDALFEETGIRISINTLKRLFGKIKTKRDYKPQRASLNAIAKYLGYSSFYEYEQSNAVEVEDQKPQVPSKAYLPKLIVALLILVVIILSFFTYRTIREKLIGNSSDHLALPQEVLIKVNPSSSRIPSKVDFIYEVPGDLLKKGEGEFVLNGKSYPLQASRNIISEELSEPGIYRGRVMINKKIYKSQAFSILSDGWIFLNGSKEFNDKNRGSNPNVKVEAKIIKDFYVPDHRLLLELEYDTLIIPKNLSNQLKIKLKLVFDHDEVFFVFYGDDVLNNSPFNQVAGEYYPDVGNHHILTEGLPLNFRIEGHKDNFTIQLNDKVISSFPKKQQMGDLRMIAYESRRIKLTLQKFTVQDKQGPLHYDVLSE